MLLHQPLQSFTNLLQSCPNQCITAQPEKIWQRGGRLQIKGNILKAEETGRRLKLHIGGGRKGKIQVL
jgi:hypothetical protein